ncbi:MAG: 4Fe-4S dicluster domain-containing protein [Chloroflexota bacterium]
MKNERYQIHIRTEWCKGCQFCVEFCPKHVLHQSGEFNRRGYNMASAEANNDCIGCGMCELICPEFAISVTPLEEEQANE